MSKRRVRAYQLWDGFLYGLGHVAFLVFIAPFFRAGELYQRWTGKQPLRLPQSPPYPKDRNSQIVACYIRPVYEATEDSGAPARTRPS